MIGSPEIAPRLFEVITMPPRLGTSTGGYAIAPKLPLGLNEQ